MTRAWFEQYAEPLRLGQEPDGLDLLATLDSPDPDLLDTLMGEFECGPELGLSVPASSRWPMVARLMQMRGLYLLSPGCPVVRFGNDLSRRTLFRQAASGSVDRKPVAILRAHEHSLLEGEAPVWELRRHLVTDLARGRWGMDLPLQLACSLAETLASGPNPASGPTLGTIRELLKLLSLSPHEFSRLEPDGHEVVVALGGDVRGSGLAPLVSAVTVGPPGQHDQRLVEAVAQGLYQVRLDLKGYRCLSWALVQGWIPAQGFVRIAQGSVDDGELGDGELGDGDLDLTGGHHWRSLAQLAFWCRTDLVPPGGHDYGEGSEGGVGVWADRLEVLQVDRVSTLVRRADCDGWEDPNLRRTRIHSVFAGYGGAVPSVFVSHTGDGYGVLCDGEPADRIDASVRVRVLPLRARTADAVDRLSAARAQNSARARLRVLEALRPPLGSLDEAEIVCELAAAIHCTEDELRTDLAFLRGRAEVSLPATLAELASSLPGSFLRGAEAAAWVPCAEFDGELEAVVGFALSPGACSPVSVVEAAFLPGLQELSFRGVPISDDQLAAFFRYRPPPDGSAQGITRLDLSNTEIAHLGFLGNSQLSLEHLALCGLNLEINEESLRQLRGSALEINEDQLARVLVLVKKQDSDFEPAYDQERARLLGGCGPVHVYPSGEDEIDLPLGLALRLQNVCLWRVPDQPRKRWVSLSRLMPPPPAGSVSRSSPSEKESLTLLASCRRHGSSGQAPCGEAPVSCTCRFHVLEFGANRGPGGRPYSLVRVLPVLADGLLPTIELCRDRELGPPGRRVLLSRLHGTGLSLGELADLLSEAVGTIEIDLAVFQRFPLGTGREPLCTFEAGGLDWERLQILANRSQVGPHDQKLLDGAMGVLAGGPIPLQSFESLVLRMWGGVMTPTGSQAPRGLGSRR
ncbi:MAG: hypothetical protein JKY65_01225 [Planctomycetes bacterium]|nr:hypothetical protein [Planctomycetota bacterium]